MGTSPPAPTSLRAVPSPHERRRRAASHHPGTEAAHLPVDDDAAAARLLRGAVEAGVEVLSFAPLRGALEETCLALEGERR